MGPVGVHRLSVPVNPADHIAGSPDAPLVLLEYGDYECPYCGAAHAEVVQVQRAFGDRLAFVFRNFPLANIHPHALAAAEVAEAAGGQGRFWPMHHHLFEHQHALDEESLVAYAVQLGLDVPRLVEDLASHRYLPKVRADLASGLESGVQGTPTFFINGVRHDGGWDAATLAAALQASVPA